MNWFYLIEQLAEHTFRGGVNPIVSLFRCQKKYHKPVYNKISTRFSKKRNFRNYKRTNLLPLMKFSKSNFTQKFISNLYSFYMSHMPNVTLETYYPCWYFLNILQTEKLSLKSSKFKKILQLHHLLGFLWKNCNKTQSQIEITDPNVKFAHTNFCFAFVKTRGP